MIISLHATSEAQLQIQPDPAIVHVGDRVAWELFFDSPRRNFRSPLLWIIYFREKHAFRNHYGSEWQQRSEPNQKVIVDAGKAEEHGDYKYGVRIINAETGKELSDDDPRLIVIR